MALKLQLEKKDKRVERGALRMEQREYKHDVIIWSLSQDYYWRSYWSALVQEEKQWNDMEYWLKLGLYN